MRAVVYDRYGQSSPLAVRELPDPAPRAGEILVKVAFASLNPIDYKLRNGMAKLIRRPKLPAVPGVDGAGTVYAVGKGVTQFAVGQRVFGSTRSLTQYGTCAQLAVFPVNQAAPTPATVGDAEAACLTTAVGTAVEAFERHTHVGADQRVLVVGASGAVGAAAVQLAVSLGASVTGVCSTANVAYVEQLGAARVFDYKISKWTDEAGAYDVIFDAAAATSWGEAKPHLAPRGVFIEVMPRGYLFVRAALGRVIGGRRPVAQLVKKDPELLGRVAELARTEVVRTRIAQTVELEDVEAALRAVEVGKVHGKVVVRVPA